MAAAKASDAPGAKLAETAVSVGEGWQALDVLCTCGPADEGFEEQHDRFVVAAVTEGGFVYRHERQRVFIAAGSLMLGKPGRCYRCEHQQPGGDRSLALRCDHGVLEEIMTGHRGHGALRLASPRIPPHRRVAPVFAAMLRLPRIHSPARREEVALDVVAAALRMAEDAQEAPVSLRDEARVATAVQRIRSGSDGPLGLADLAAEARVSRHHFLRIFRRVVGVTPYAYQLTQRLQAAASALASRPGSVLDVALEAGFSDLSEFTRQFRRAFGRTPGQYRRSSDA